jgi:uncharacterized membrane protein YjjP (DUF1212 family)
MSTPPPPGARDAIQFVLDLARALHRLGYPSHWLEDGLETAARRLGLEGEFFATPTSVFAAFGRASEQRTHLLRLSGGEQHLERLAEVVATGRAVLSGGCTAADGSARLRAVLASPARYPGWATMAAFALSGAAAGRFLGGGPRESLAAAALGGVVAGLALLPARWPALARVFPAVAAFVVSALAAATSAAAGFQPGIATPAALLILLPGLALTAALAELSSQHLVSGTARVLGALTEMLALAFGVAMGVRVVEALAGPPVAARVVAQPFASEVLALVLAPLAFMVLLRAAPRDYPWMLAVGAAAHAVARLVAPGLGPELATFLGAFTASALSHGASRLRQRPAAITLLPALLLLVPGSLGFRGLSLLIDREVTSGVEAAFRMVLLASALVAGILLAGAVVPSYGLGDAPVRTPRPARD